jgi:hypothetical protein
LVEPLAADRTVYGLIRFPFGQLARGDPGEQLVDRAPEREG